MFSIIVKNIDKIVAYDYLTIKDRPSHYGCDNDFVNDIFESAKFAVNGNINYKYDDSKIISFEILNNETEDSVISFVVNKQEAYTIYDILTSLECMELIYVKSLSAREIYTKFAFDATSRLILDKQQANEYFNKYIVPAINRVFNRFNQKVIDCLEPYEFQTIFHCAEKVYLRTTPKDKRLLSQYQLYALMFAAKNHYLNTINIKNRI